MTKTVKIISIFTGVIALLVFFLKSNIKLFIVLSGSMEPVIKTGSLIFTKPESVYKQGDIVTFNDSQSNIPTTHRITEINNLITTKGDANNISDFQKITKDKIIGKTFFSIPYIGYLISYLKISPTNSYFIDQKTVSNNFNSGQFIVSSSYITNSDSVVKDDLIQINYQTENDENLDYVQLCYSFNLSSTFECPNLASFKSNSGLFNFKVNNDGIYQFYTIAYDKSGNNENNNDFIPNIYQVLIDTKNPFTSLSLGEFGTNWSAVNNQIDNGDFENTIDSLNGWDVSGDGQHSVTSSDVKSGENSAIIGWQSIDPTVDGVDKISKTVSLPTTTSTLSFWYKFVSDDISDYDWFEVKISEDTILKLGNNSSYLQYDSGWQQFTYNLNRLLGKDVELIFQVTNHQDLKSYALVDEVRITNSNNLIDPNTPITINNYDSGSGIYQTFYQIGDSGFKEYTDPFTLTSESIDVGQSVSVSYFSTDIAGNIGTSETINLIVESLANQQKQISADINTIPDNKISLTINDIYNHFKESPTDYLDYEITYYQGDIEKGIYGSVDESEIINNNFTKDFYLGTCTSGGVCTPDNISIGSTINLSLNGLINNQPLTQIIKSIIYNP